MCGSRADIQSATAEIRRGKKRKKKIEETTEQKYNVDIYDTGWPEQLTRAHFTNTIMPYKAVSDRAVIFIHLNSLSFNVSHLQNDLLRLVRS